MSGIALRGAPHALESTGAWLLGLLWILPLVYAFWTAFHPERILDPVPPHRAADAR